MDKADIPFLPASQLSQLIHDRTVSPVEAVEAYLDRIDRLNGKLYAYLTVCRDEALAAAQNAELALARGESRGPLHGIPFAVKDQLNTAGIRTTSGTPIFNDFVPDEDATVVARLKAAGAVLLGKLNMTEFGTTGFSHAFETARNPLGPGKAPRRLQQRLRGRHGGIPVRHFPGRGHRRVHKGPRRLVRAGRSQAHLGPGQPPRPQARHVVHGYHRPHQPHHGRLRHDPPGRCRTRPQ